jgi:hypothetical protein
VHKTVALPGRYRPTRPEGIGLYTC